MKRSLFSLALAFSSIALIGQNNDPVVMTVNGKDVKMSEFEYIYNKNNNENAIDKRSLDEYVVLFKNFKLRVAEAEAQGMDTMESFHKELNEYRTQLARPYLTMEEMDEDLLKQAYDRAQVYSEVSGVFLVFPKVKSGESYTITPADTLEIYNKAMEIRKMATKKGSDFSKLVIEYTDDDRSKENKQPGHLGWFSSLNLVPSLEKPIYETPAGGITMPVRTPQGYYLLKVHNKKQNPGEVHAAHILITIPEDADAVQISDAEKKIEEINQKLKDGADFGELAKEYSSDPGSAAKGGDLSWFQFGQMVPAFNDKVFSMTEIGSVSEPVKTNYGYHIIKLLDKKENGPAFTDLRQQIKTKFERTGGYYELYKPELDKLKASHNYLPNPVAYAKLKEAASREIPTDSVYIAKFQNDKEVLFTLGGQGYSVADFSDHLKSNSRSYFNLSTELLKDKYDQFVYDKLIEVEDKTLESRYSEFKNLMQEYRDGILLFEVSNKEVWEKASTDTVGLDKYFNENKNKYAWNEPHWKGYIILAKDAGTKKKMQKEISKKNNDDAVKYLLENYIVGDVSNVKIEKGLFKKGQNIFVDEAIFKAGKAECPEEYQDFFLLGKNLKETPECYSDVRGMVITDYQDYLEKEWLQYLNNKYPVVIYKEVIDTLK